MTDDIGAGMPGRRSTRAGRRRRVGKRRPVLGFWPVAVALLGGGVMLALMLGMFWLLFVVPIVAFLGGVVAYAALAPGTPQRTAHWPGMDLLSETSKDEEEP